MRLLIAEDERDLARALSAIFEKHNYSADAVYNGVDALDYALSGAYDGIVLDVMMPGLNGFEVVKKLREKGVATPVLLLTAKSEVPDRVEGLDAGADDYLPKPFDPAELLARIRALLRRAGPLTQEEQRSVIEVGDLRVDPAARRAWRGGRELELSKTEFDLLELLALNAGIVLDRTTIYERIWGYDFGPDSKNLAVYISYLRRKVDDREGSSLIHTVRGVGYTLRAD